MNENEIGDIVLGGAINVHSALGTGLLESAYEICLAHEITKQGLSIKQQVLLPAQYNGLKLDAGYRLDLLVHNKVIVELKAVE
jgi:GxxExxY protein